MTHLSVPDERKKALDITPNLVRISIGVEDADDLIADFERAERGLIAEIRGEMILRHLAGRLKQQDWIAVGIEFVLVVVGVFLGIQVANWNGDRRERALELAYLRAHRPGCPQRQLRTR